MLFIIEIEVGGNFLVFPVEVFSDHKFLASEFCRVNLEDNSDFLISLFGCDSLFQFAASAFLPLRSRFLFQSSHGTAPEIFSMVSMAKMNACITPLKTSK